MTPRARFVPDLSQLSGERSWTIMKILFRSQDESIVLVPYPSIPLEEVYVRQRSTRGISSMHTSDLRTLVWVIAIACISLVVLLPASSMLILYVDSGKSLFELSRWDALKGIMKSIRESIDLSVLAALLGSVVAAMAGIYQMGKQRFSTVDVFSSEIAARMRILAADQSVQKIIQSAATHTPRLQSEALDQFRSGHTPGPSQESQFEIFYRRSTDLGSLSSSVVDHVTAFYSFHMAARDQLRALLRSIEDDRNSTEITENVVDVLYMVDLMALNAYKALGDLVETAEHKLHCFQISLCVGMQANKYLCDTMSKEDPRYPEVLQRGVRLKQLAKALRQDIRKYGLAAEGRAFF